MTQDQVARARTQTLGDLLRRSARRHPDKPALVDGEHRLSYGELDTAVNRIAHALSARGLARGDRLALLSRNCWQFAALVMAAARLGVVLVPVNFMLSAREVTYILEHSGARALVWQEALEETATRALDGLYGPGVPLRATVGDVGAWACHGPAGEPESAVGEDEVIRLMYTSGTESRPKGAMLTTRGLLWQYVSCLTGGEMTGDDVEVHAMPLYHCAQLDCFLLPDLYAGATSVLLPAPDPAALLAAVARERATKLFCPPTVWISLLRHPDFAATDLSSLRKGYYGASPMPVEVLRELRERLPRVRLWNFYGQTEMAPMATLLRPEEQLSHAGSAGRPALNVETRIVDDSGAEVAPGEVGEIVHRSPQATLGYYNDPDLTAEAFRDGWFHSGDLGVLSADGHLTVVDRKKDMIKTGGENVASREVEEVLFQHPRVAEAAVFGVSDPHWVEAVTAAVVPKPGSAGAGEEELAGELREHCRERLAGFKTPKRVVVVEALPKNPSGKILKRELRARFEGGR
ncbi:fatty acyl-CoA synthetase [Streptomyces boncukensis]|uniref:Long-chain-fatty-acid--CoA ligase n=1 Tax=Streptomyces boncukensis TaxID=2711219 RepID=A0A6G4X749_9ACTN|nr:fatty acyl-CoA synthetase [Streptomyces boncukensis]NGO73369.1 long-chain-fatty-acid--CoA ligase [Streptomyces boncukensis]